VWGIIVLVIGIKLASACVNVAAAMQYPNDDGQWLLYGLGHLLLSVGWLSGLGGVFSAIKHFYNRHCSKATGFTQPVHDAVR
jgi:hypothetical protein